MSDEATLTPSRKLAEPARLDALAASSLMDSAPEAPFDRAVTLASSVLDAPVSLFSLVDDERQFFKAQEGLSGETAQARQTPLTHSFCQHVVTKAEPLRVTDAREHPLVRDNLAIRDLDVVAYLGVPVRDPDGHVLGSLCAIAPEPRDWNERDLDHLSGIARGIETELSLRAALAEAETQRTRIRKVLDALPIGVVIADAPSAAITSVNSWGESLLADEVEADDASDYRAMGAQHADGSRYRADEYPLVRAAVHDEIVTDEPTIYRRNDGTLFDLEVSAHRMDDGRAIATFVDVTERNRASEAARVSREQLVRVLEGTADPIIVMNADWLVTYANGAARKALAGGRDVVGRNVWEAFPDWVESPLWHAYQDALRTGAPGRAELEHAASRAWYEARVFPTKHDLTAFFRDVTAEREATETRQLLVRELNHRVKNLFAVIAGMIGMTARHTRTPAEMASALRGRIGALARSHELIRPAVTQEAVGPADVSIQNLVSSLIEPHLQHESDRIRLEGPSVNLGANGATSLSLVLHELATNAAKYGALSVPDGVLTVSWEVVGDTLTMEWTEAGGPPVTTPTHRGFGSTLVDMSVRSQLRGSFDVEWRPNGMFARLALSLARLQA